MASRHCGWCTKELAHARNYLFFGRMFGFKKKGSKRFSYLLSVNGTGIQLRRKGNRFVQPEQFFMAYPKLLEIPEFDILNVLYIT